MKILFTGATGFLGKHLLRQLLEDNRISKVNIISRTKRSHPHSKVRLFAGDLSEPACVASALQGVEAIIHLAGLYDLTQPLSENYRNNVLPTLNLIERVKEIDPEKSLPVFMASTYAVGLGRVGILRESRLDQLPSKSCAYAYTKALAERALHDSGLKARIFRFGILVGDQKSGSIEKIDGPYAFLKLFTQLANLPGLSSLNFGKFGIKKFLLPFDPNAVLPMVPVDLAAKVLHEALFMSLTEQTEYFGVFNPLSANLKDFAESTFKEILPSIRPFFKRNFLTDSALSAQLFFTRIPQDLLLFAASPIPLENPKFKDTFGAQQIPDFSQYQEPFFSGFKNHVQGRIVC